MPLVKMKTDLSGVWNSYWRTGGTSSRNALMENYLPIVRYNAERIAAKLPDEVDTDDLISAGIFGLMDAISAFDVSRGVKFETYCAPRIRGAILDELRMMDWVPRLVRTRSQKLDRTRRELEADLGRAPSYAEIHVRMKITKEDFKKILRDSTAVSLVSLSRKHYESDSSRDVTEIDILEDRRGRDPVAETLKKDLKELISRGLNRAERLILVLYYYEELTMKEIGATLDLSESRVSQMHSSVMGRLKAQLERRRQELTQTV